MFNKQNDAFGCQNDAFTKRNDAFGYQNDAFTRQNDAFGCQNDVFTQKRRAPRRLERSDPLVMSRKILYTNTMAAELCIRGQKEEFCPLEKNAQNTKMGYDKYGRSRTWNFYRKEADVLIIVYLSLAVIVLAIVAFIVSAFRTLKRLKGSLADFSKTAAKFNKRIEGIIKEKNQLTKNIEDIQQDFYQKKEKLQDAVLQVQGVKISVQEGLYKAKAIFNSEKAKV